MGRTLFDKTFASVCAGICRIDSICNVSNDSPLIEVAEGLVVPAISFIVAIGIDRGEVAERLAFDTIVFERVL